MKLVEVLIIVAIVALLVLFIVCSIIKTRKCANKIILKIDEAKEEISVYLDESVKLLDNTTEYIKDEDYDGEFHKINFKGMSSDEVYQIVKKYNVLLKNKILEDEELNKNKNFFKVVDEFRKVVSYIDGSVKYYSTNVEAYRNIFSRFPAKMVKVFCGYKEFVDYKEDKMGKL